VNIVYIIVFLGMFTKFQKATLSFVMSVYLSICLPARMEQLLSYWTDLYETLSIFQKYTFLVISHPVLRMRNVSDKSCRKQENTFYVQ
jgi:hypothetical protein